MQKNKRTGKVNTIVMAGIISLLLSACSPEPVHYNEEEAYTPPKTGSSVTIKDPETATSSGNVTYLDSTPVCLECTAPGTDTVGNEFVTVDYSNHKDGYIMVDYVGTAQKTKLQLTGPDNVTYTYDLHNGPASFPLTAGDGNYSVSVCENIIDSKYSVVFADTLSLTGISEFGPYLHPSSYVNYTASCKTVKKGAELASKCTTKLEVVTSIYDYITSNITYDYDKAETVQSGYTTDVDTILSKGTGICLDYSAVMATMLRTQSIPTRLEVGYTGKDMVYHAWISVYIEDIGWINGIIRFNGNEWSLVDPTFGASMGDSNKLKSYIGDGTNYSVKYIY